MQHFSRVLTLALFGLSSGLRAEEASLESLMETARSGDPYDRGRALLALGQRKDPRTIPVLAEAIKAGSAGLRLQAFDALAAFGDRKALLELIPPLLNDPNPSIRHAATLSLASQVTPTDTPLLDTLAKALKDDYRMVRHAAIEAFIKLEAPGAKYLIPALSDPDEDLRQRALSAFAKHKVVEATPALIELAGSENAAIRLGAVQALALLKTEEALSGLEAKLSDKDDRVRAVAVRAVAETRGKEKVAPETADTSKKDLSPTTREITALEALRKNLKAEALPAIQKALKHKEAEVREAAAEQIRKLAEQNGSLPDPTVQALLKALEDPSEPVRYQVRGALRVLAGQDFRFDTQRWADWHKTRTNPQAQTIPFHQVEGTLREELAFEPLGKVLLPFGRALDVAVRGDWAYVATGEGGVALYDLSNRQAPRLADRHVTFVPGHVTEGHGWARDSNGVCSQIVLSGDRLYFIARHSGFATSGVELTALDISHPGKLRHLGGFPPIYGAHTHSAIAADGNFVYSVQGNSVVIYDLTDPQQPQQAGAFDARAPVTAIASAGKRVLIGVGEAGLRVLDASNPASPQARDLYPDSGKVTALVVSGDQVVVGTEKKGLHVLRLQDDTLLEPRVLALDSPGTVLAAGPKRVYVSTATGMRVIDLSNPAQPQLLPGTDFVKGSRLSAWREGVAVADTAHGLRLLAPEGGAWQTKGEVLSIGDATDLELRGGLALLAAGQAGILVLDLQAPAQPRLIGRMPVEGFAHRIVPQDNRAFVAAGLGGLAVVDLADPKAPKLLHQIPVKAITEIEKAEVRDVFLEGNTAYLAVDRVGLVVVDLTDPGQPKSLGQFQFSDERAGPRAVEVRKGIAYVACGRAGLYLLDVSNLAQPKQLSWFWDEEGHRRMATWDVRVRENLAFLADADLGLLLIDVSQPTAPKLAGRFHTGNAHQLALYGNRAFLADGGYGLRAVDIASPAQLRHLGSFNNERVFFKGLRFLDENTLVIAGAWELQTFRLTSKRVLLRSAFSLSQDGSPRPLLGHDRKPLAPEAVSQRYGIDFTLFDEGQDVCGEGYPGRNSPGHRLRPVYQDLSENAGWPNVRVRAGTVAIDPRLGRVKFSDGDSDPCRIMGWEPLPMGICHSLRISGNHVFMSDEEGWNIVIWDVSDALKPVRKGLACTGGFCIGSLWVQGERDLVIGGNNMGRFTIFDVSNVERPIPVGWFPGNARCVVASGHHAFDISGNLVAWDISNPRAPKKVAEVTDGSMALNMTGSFANPQVLAIDKYIIGAGGPGLRVIDVTNMPNLKVLAEHPIPVKCLEVKGGRLYAGDGSVVRIFDFSDPKRPVLLGRCALPWGFNAITVDGNFLYAAGWSLQVVDVSDPCAPRLTGGCGQINFITGNTHQNIVNAVVAKDNAVYTAQPGWGLSVFDVTDKANPKALLGDPLQTLAMGGDFTGIYVRGDYAFSANNWSGVKVVDISEPTRPRHIFNTKLFDSGASLGVAANDDLFIYHSSVTGTMIFDYSDPTDIREVGRPQPQPQPPPGWGNAGGIHFCVRGNYAYGGGQVLDITYPLRTKVVSKFPGSCPGGLAGNFLFGTGTVVDVSQPEKPVVVGRSPALQGAGWYGRGLYATEQTVYSVTRAGLLITDVTDPTRPRFLAHRPLPHFPSDVWIQGDLAYVALYYGGVDILDVSDPARPRLVDHFEYGPFWDFGGWDNLVCYQSAAIDGEYLCANEYYSGLHVIDVPTAPALPKGKLTARVFVGR